LIEGSTKPAKFAQVFHILPGGSHGYFCFNNIFRLIKSVEEEKQDSIPQAPSINGLVIERIKEAKEMMINFGTIELVYQRDSSNFQCLKPVNLAALRSRLRKIHDLLKEAYQVSPAETFALFDEDSNAYNNEMSKCKDDNLPWIDKLGFPHVSVTALPGAPKDLSNRVFVV